MPPPDLPVRAARMALNRAADEVRSGPVGNRGEHAAHCLVERATELQHIRVAVADAVRGAGSVIVVEGPAGIGKTRLLDTACAEAANEGLALLRARGGILERELAHGAVRLLLERPLAALDDVVRDDVLEGAAALAAPALATAGVGGAAPADRGHAINHGLFWCVANLAERRPLLLALDDVHWFDAPSLRFVLYLARRVADLPVLIVAATRQGEAGSDSVLVEELQLQPGASVLRPNPLSAAGVAQMLAARFATEIAPEFAEACHAAVGGNPFLLTELADALRADGILPTACAAASVRDVRPPTLSRAILLRVGRMPGGAQDLATAVAVLGEAVDLGMARRLAGLSEEAAATALDALAAGEVLRAELPLDFVHPIVREAVYGELGPARRARWHARAVELLQATGTPRERVAPHMLWTAPAGCGETVEALRGAARGALDRGAPDIAARYLERALAEPPGDDVRGPLLLELATAGFLAGEPTGRLAELTREAIAITTAPPARARAWLLLSRIIVMDRSVTGAAAVLEEALRDLGDAGEELRLPLETELRSHGLTHPGTVAAVAERIDVLVPPAGRTHSERLTLCSIATRDVFLGRDAVRTAGLAMRAFAGGRLVQVETGDSMPVYQTLYALALADRFEELAEMFELVIADGRRRGSVLALGAAIGCRGGARYMAGRVADAEADGRQALATPGLPPFPRPAISAYLALALVDRGALAEAEQVLADAGTGPELPEVLHMNNVLWARARLRLAQGRPRDALDDLREFGRRSDAVQMRNPALPWRAEAALLHARLGETDAARRLHGEYAEQAREWGTARVLGIAARTEGLLVECERGLERLHDAVEILGDCPSPREQAESWLCLGAALRRAGRRSDARPALARAVELAAACGATALAARAGEELGVAGATSRRHAFSGVEGLTPSERRVARMAADGLSNREIAETLFVTAKTVENHLGRTYMKLGICSRAELGKALGTQAAAAG